VKSSRTIKGKIKRKSSQAALRTSNHVPPDAQDPAKPSTLPSFDWARQSLVLFGGAKWLGKLALAILGAVGTLSALLGGPLWPTNPEFSVPAPFSITPFQVPFLVRNKSGVFTLRNLNIRCFLDDVYFAGEPVERMHISGGMYVTDGLNISTGQDFLGPARDGFFTCPFEGVFGSRRIEITSAKIHFDYQFDLTPFGGHRSGASDICRLSSFPEPRHWMCSPNLR
jgi:hypothetical protein